MKKTALCIAMILLAAPLCAMSDDDDNDVEMGQMRSIRSTKSESSGSNATHPGESYSVNIGERDSDPALPRDEHVPRHRQNRYHPDERFFTTLNDNQRRIADQLDKVNGNLLCERMTSGIPTSLGAFSIAVMLFCGVGHTISSAISDASYNLGNNLANSRPQCSCSCPACPAFPPAPVPTTMAYNNDTTNSTLSMNSTQFMAMAANMRKKEKID